MILHVLETRLCQFHNWCLIMFIQVIFTIFMSTKFNNLETSLKCIRISTCVCMHSINHWSALLYASIADQWSTYVENSHCACDYTYDIMIIKFKPPSLFTLLSWVNPFLKLLRSSVTLKIPHYPRVFKMTQILWLVKIMSKNFFDIIIIMLCHNHWIRFQLRNYKM